MDMDSSLLSSSAKLESDDIGDEVAPTTASALGDCSVFLLLLLLSSALIVLSFSIEEELGGAEGPFSPTSATGRFRPRRSLLLLTSTPVSLVPSSVPRSRLNSSSSSSLTDVELLLLLFLTALTTKCSSACSSSCRAHKSRRLLRLLSPAAVPAWRRPDATDEASENRPLRMLSWLLRLR